MTHPKLESIRERLSHGDAVLQVLVSDLNDYHADAAGSLSLRQEYDAATGVLAAWIDAPFAPPLRIGLLAGDVVHAWRASLDNLVEAMLERNEWPPSANHQFPIESVNNSRGRRNVREQTTGVNDADRAAIDAAQPFTLGDDADAHPLAAIRDLSNYDKHHVILPTVHAYAIKIRLPGQPDWVPITDVRLAFRPGVETALNFWLRGVAGGEIDTFELHGPNPEHEIIRLKLKNVTAAEPRMVHDEIPTEYAFWSPRNAANPARLEQMRDFMWALLRETSDRWLAEDQSVG